MGFLRFLWARHRVLALILAGALVFGLWQAVDLVTELVYFAQADHIRQPLQMWMSPRYVGKSWDLPREVIVQVMDLQPDNAQPTLREVTGHLGITLSELETRIRAAADRQEALEFLRRMGDGR